MSSAERDGFSPDWLALREAADHRARAGALVDRLRAEWRAQGWTRIVDLGSGTGSNLRYLAPRLPGPQQWTLVDHDAELLARAGAAGTAAEVRCVHGDLTAAGLPAAAQADLVTCSALLDLVPEDWLQRLARACRDAGCGAYLALTYDGVMQWSAAGSAGGGPDGASDPDDAAIREAVNAHQRRDRGPATALGPDAAAAAEALLRAVGYRTWRLPSPWRLGTGDRALALALIDGWENAALDLSPSARRGAPDPCLGAAPAADGDRRPLRADRGPPGPARPAAARVAGPQQPGEPRRAIGARGCPAAHACR